MVNSLSVVIPNYNNGRYLRQCVGSIVSQTYKGICEIIIVDDCSTDNSREVILELAANYPLVKPLLLNKNGKVSAARNAGLDIAVGKYITFIDADDCYYNIDKLSNEMSLIEEYAEKGQDIVSYSSIVFMSNDGETYRYSQNKRRYYLEGNVYRKLLLDVRSSMVMRDYCIKTELLRSVGGYVVGNSLFEDFELLLKIAKNTRFFYTGEFGTAYRDSVTGLSKKSPKVLAKAKKEIIKKQIETESIMFKLSIKAIKSILDVLKGVRRSFRRLFKEGI